MKMQYTYKFSTGFETIEVDKETYDILKELDRLDRNKTKVYRSHTIRIEAFSFVPKFMGVEDNAFQLDPPNSLAYEYAMQKIYPKYKDILIRRLVNRERFEEIAESYKVTDQSIKKMYYRAKSHFKKHYEDGQWLFSKENMSLPEEDRIRVIPWGISHTQILQIRAYRKEHKSIAQISKLVGVTKTRVTECLQQNPVTEVKCLYCNAILLQDSYSQLRNFCSQACYYKWFRREAMIHNTCPTQNTNKVYMTQTQCMIVDFYRQYFLSQQEISKLTGIPDYHIGARVFAHPLPYTICIYCGAQIPGEPGKRVPKYCSNECRKAHTNKIKYAQRKGTYNPTPLTLPTCEQLEEVIKLRKSGSTLKQIDVKTGVKKDYTKLLFRFYSKSKKGAH